MAPRLPLLLRAPSRADLGHIQLLDPKPGWPTATSRNPGSPADLPTAPSISQILAGADWSEFLSQLYQPHGQVHGWVGGTMGVVAFAAYDPIFWAHHGMIDRLWYLWQLQHPGGGPSPQDLDLVLPPFNLNVR